MKRSNSSATGVLNSFLISWFRASCARAPGSSRARRHSNTDRRCGGWARCRAHTCRPGRQRRAAYPAAGRWTGRRVRPVARRRPVARQVEPASLKALKEEISRRWGVIDLLDLIKETGHVTQFTSQFTSVASRTVTDPEVIRRRLLLCLYGLGRLFKSPQLISALVSCIIVIK